MSVPATAYPAHINTTNEYRRSTREIYDTLSEQERHILERCAARVHELAIQQGYDLYGSYINFTLGKTDKGVHVFAGPVHERHGARMIGLLEGIGLAGNGRQPVSFSPGINAPMGSVRFANIAELGMAVNATAKNQDQKIDLSGGQRLR